MATLLGQSSPVNTLEREVVSRNDDAISRYAKSNATGTRLTFPLSNGISEPQVGSSTPDDKALEYITGARLYLVLFGVTAVMFLVMLDMTIVVTVIPSISNDFDSIKDIGWYGISYLLSSATLQPLSGKLSQYYTSKTLFLLGVLLFEIGSLICALSRSSDLFIIGRTISGIGASGLVVGMLTILASSAPVEKRPLYLGFMMGVASLGLVLGPVIGGLLSQHASWRWCFWINLPIGATTATLLAFIHIPNAAILLKQTSSNAPVLTLLQTLSRLDVPGFLLFAPACVTLLLAIQWGGVSYAWNSGIVMGLLCGSAMLLGVFLTWELKRGDEAMIPFYLLMNRVVVCAAVTMMLSQGSLMVVTYYLPLWFQVVKDASPTMGGVYYLPSVESQIIGSIVTGVLTTRTGYYTPFAILGTALTSLSSGLLSTLSPTSSPAPWIIYQLLSGFSRGLTIQQPLTALSVALPASNLPIGTSFLMFIQILGGALSISFAQTIFSNGLKPTLGKYAPDVSPEVVFSVGASAFVSVVEKEQVHGVVKAYNEALNQVFYLAAGTAGVAFFAAWGLGWTNLKTVEVGRKVDVESMKVDNANPELEVGDKKTESLEEGKK
ncbi:related to MFS multidrug transporter [Rhynchosporium graminicola]|uniref:Related to MFS multidrug transporter n=1 Tax=Rhynchosporium graminicola TaxID=2792576 RepID=A0A1E1KL02_9HELO|nr:related to MFS multidrug transporter [Rhynchosporium commune]